MNRYVSCIVPLIAREELYCITLLIGFAVYMCLLFPWVNRCVTRTVTLMAREQCFRVMSLTGLVVDLCFHVLPGEQVCELHCFSDGHGRVLLPHVTEGIFCLPVFLCPKVDRCVSFTVAPMAMEGCCCLMSLTGFVVDRYVYVPR